MSGDTMRTFEERRRTVQAVKITAETTATNIPGAIDIGGSILYPEPGGGFKTLPANGYLVEVAEGSYRHESAMSFEHDWAPVDSE